MDTCPFCGSWKLMTEYFEDDYGYFCPDCGRQWIDGQEEGYGWGENIEDSERGGDSGHQGNKPIRKKQ